MLLWFLPCAHRLGRRSREQLSTANSERRGKKYAISYCSSISLNKQRPCLPSFLGGKLLFCAFISYSQHKWGRKRSSLLPPFHTQLKNCSSKRREDVTTFLQALPSIAMNCGKSTRCLALKRRQPCNTPEGFPVQSRLKSEVGPPSRSLVHFTMRSNYTLSSMRTESKWQRQAEGHPAGSNAGSAERRKS